MSCFVGVLWVFCGVCDVSVWFLYGVFCGVSVWCIFGVACVVWCVWCGVCGACGVSVMCRCSPRYRPYRGVPRGGGRRGPCPPPQTYTGRPKLK